MHIYDILFFMLICTVYSIIYYGYTYISFYTCIQSLGTILPVAICLRERRMTFPATSTQLLFQGEDVCAHQRFSFGKGGRACGHADDAEDQIWIFRSFTYACRVVGWKSKVQSGRKKLQNYGCSFFFWLWIMSSYPFVACYSLLSFSLVQIFPFSRGQKEPMPQL